MMMMMMMIVIHRLLKEEFTDARVGVYDYLLWFRHGSGCNSGNQVMETTEIKRETAVS